MNVSPLPSFSRRAMLRGCLGGFGYLAFAGLAAQGARRPPHFTPSTKSLAEHNSRCDSFTSGSSRSTSFKPC